MSYRERYRKNDEEKKQQRRKLRGNLTRAEYILWQELRNHKLGFKFRRQASIDAFIVDFYCHELRLIIEVDGFVHDEAYQISYDERRQNYLESKEYTVLRFTNDDVLFEREHVMSEILKKCRELLE